MARARKAKAPEPAPADPWAAVVARHIQEGHQTVSDAQAAEGQAPEAAAPPEGEHEDKGQAPDPQGQEPGESNTPNEDPRIAQMEAQIKALRQEAAQHRRRAKDAEEDARKRAEAELSDADRLARTLDEEKAARQKAEERARRLALESAVALRSQQLGIRDAEAAIALLDREGLYDEDGDLLKGELDTRLRDLLKAKPYLKAQQAPPSPASAGRQGPRGETDAERRARLFGGPGQRGGIFDAEAARARGGGVIFPTS